MAVITGGTTGIGLATAKLFVKEGVYVFITGRRPSCHQLQGAAAMTIELSADHWSSSVGESIRPRELVLLAKQSQSRDRTLTP